MLPPQLLFRHTLAAEVQNIHCANIWLSAMIRMIRLHHTQPTITGRYEAPTSTHTVVKRRGQRRHITATAAECGDKSACCYRADRVLCCFPTHLVLCTRYIRKPKPLTVPTTFSCTLMEQMPGDSSFGCHELEHEEISH